MLINTSYNEDYYENGINLKISCYENYKWLPELTIKTAKIYIDFLNLNEKSVVLDYGCAKGYMVHALNLCNIQSYGYDISSYAIENGHPDVKKYISTNLNNFSNIKFTQIICKDVLEHINYDEIDNYIENLSNISNNLLVILPLGDGIKFICNSANSDITHKIPQTKEWWIEKFKNKFKVVNFTHHIAGISDKHYEKNKNGIGFFICKKYTSEL